ncbi:hypothetical protein BT96DRAFT_1013258 [Gymnopus androsaceus JB14]|uniref:Uncharacterized protein n=1 Tax=Gymnopus androsaceus JB14 TaxID=1447944 RepID=A0A6A4I962_9AGAR|nr:hypothetical protein BT96DRAFT_1013258 [Gymnopus androsaceus JB14]
MTSSPFDQFFCLDELIQAYYLGTQKFVLLSRVTKKEWAIDLGLQGTEGRWWRGIWKEKDLLAHSGPKSSSDKLLDIAEQVAESIVKNEVVLSGWTIGSPNAKLKLLLAVSSDKPIHFQLTEISAEEAASYASQVLFQIATRAQSRNCQLHGTYEVPVASSDGNLVFFITDVSPMKAHAPLAATLASSSLKSLNRESGSSSSKKRVESGSRNAAAQPAPSKKRKERRESSSSEPEDKPKPKLPPKPKGASLANPSKKARKFQPVQFESDDD